MYLHIIIISIISCSLESSILYGTSLSPLWVLDSWYGATNGYNVVFNLEQKLRERSVLCIQHNTLRASKELTHLCDDDRGKLSVYQNMQHRSMSLLTNLKKQPVGGEFKLYGQARCDLRKLCGFVSVSRCLHSFFLD